ncbi:MarR family transcriptional regulator [Kitasatospora sp. NBC_00240]|uniref:MarR family winged helix-turn-helix transcriptional regulator n=1 Tax=Kitasatospora sp. NBC_00240 TaxID=2903567 RepID=UPI00224E019C|nr:MarR family transcriptional regulator [Kitasatospora sp. NBC_00240]MCX5209015.1 MarR family transcriptional regulator [Kitasatospora sp. NBC_00240]
MNDEQVLASVLDTLGAVMELRRHQSPQVRARTAMLAVLGWHGELRVVELAEHLQVDMSAVSRQLAHLEQDGLAGRRPNPADGRSCLVGPTAAGLDLLARTRLESTRRLAHATGTWDRADLRALAGLLDRLHQDLEHGFPPAAPTPPAVPAVSAPPAVPAVPAPPAAPAVSAPPAVPAVPAPPAAPARS